MRLQVEPENFHKNEKDTAMTNTIDDTDKSEIFNQEEFMNKIDGNKELAREIILEFLDETPQNIEKLKTGFEKNNMNMITQMAHLIKGVAGNICAPGLLKSTDIFEQAYKKKDKDLLKNYIMEIEKQFIELNSFIDKTDLA